MEDIRQAEILNSHGQLTTALSIAICREESSRGPAKTTIRFPVCDVGNGLEIATKAPSLAAGRSKELDGAKSRWLETARADAIRVQWGSTGAQTSAVVWGQSRLCIRGIGKTGGASSETAERQ